MACNTAAESIHALDLDGLQKSEVTFRTILQGEKLAGCGALKELDAQYAEIKSMPHRAFLRQGVARRMLDWLALKFHELRLPASQGYGGFAIHEYA